MFSFNPKFIKIALPVKMSFWILPIFAILPLVLISLVIPLPIGNTAHFGGLIAGLIYACYLKKKYKKKTEIIKKYFSS
jgi:membrane associated rhomboid family serine protease